MLKRFSSKSRSKAKSPAISPVSSTPATPRPSAPPLPAAAGAEDAAAATKIQARIRGKRARSDASDQAAAAGAIQKRLRGNKARKEAAKEKKAATTMQRIIRGKTVRKEVEAEQAAAVKVQSRVRGRAGRKSLLDAGLSPKNLAVSAVVQSSTVLSAGTGAAAGAMNSARGVTKLTKKRAYSVMQAQIEKRMIALWKGAPARGAAHDVLRPLLVSGCALRSRPVHEPSFRPRAQARSRHP